jgi:hypothetical protein
MPMVVRGQGREVGARDLAVPAHCRHVRAGIAQIVGPEAHPWVTGEAGDIGMCAMAPIDVVMR